MPLEKSQQRNGVAESRAAQAAASKGVQIEDLPYLARLLIGEFSLVKTFWLYGVLIVYVLLRVFFIVVALAEPDLALPLQLVYLLCTMFILVAVWRSAKWYSGPKAWSILARAGALLAVALTLGAVAGSS